jgi:hypothetical protein
VEEVVAPEPTDLEEVATPEPIAPVAVRAPSQPVVLAAAGTASGGAMYLIARAAVPSEALRVEETEAQLTRVVAGDLAAWAVAEAVAAAAAVVAAVGAGDNPKHH